MREARGLRGIPAVRARPGCHRREQNRSTGLEVDSHDVPRSSGLPGERVNYRWDARSARGTGAAKRSAANVAVQLRGVLAVWTAEAVSGVTNEFRVRWAGAMTPKRQRHRP